MDTMEMGLFLSPYCFGFNLLLKQKCVCVCGGGNPGIFKYIELLTEKTWLILMQDNIIPDI